MISRSRLLTPSNARPAVLPYEPGFWDALALLRVIGLGERSWEDIAEMTSLDPGPLAEALDSMVEGGMLAVRSLDEERAAFALTQRGRARLREIDAALGERGAP